MKRLRTGRREVGMLELRTGEGPTLLLLHQLGGSARDWRELAPHWPGRVVALDLAGHGDSAWCRGGSYTPELVAGDADAGLAEVGEAFVAGAGLGAYAALLLAGARPERVAAALLLPGRGLDGGGPVPDYTRPLDEVYTRVDRLLADAAAPEGHAFDPMSRTCETDVRPPEYARQFAERARRLLLAEDGSPRPAWWEEVRGARTAEAAPAKPREALARLVERE